MDAAIPANAQEQSMRLKPPSNEKSPKLADKKVVPVPQLSGLKR